MRYDLDMIFEVAKKAADKSPCKFKVGAVLVDTSSNVVATGFNHWSVNARKMGQRTIHAEVDVCNKIRKPSDNLTLFLFRKGGNSLGFNRINPCEHCAKLLKAYNITRIYCTWDLGWKEQ